MWKEKFVFYLNKLQNAQYNDNDEDKNKNLRKKHVLEYAPFPIHITMFCIVLPMNDLRQEISANIRKT